MNRLVCLAVTMFIATPAYGQQPLTQEFNFLSLDGWYERAKGLNPRDHTQHVVNSYGEFERWIKNYTDYQKKFLKDKPWIDDKIDYRLIEAEAAKDVLDQTLGQPFALKLSIKPRGSAYFWGDLHGDIQAFTLCLKKFKDDGIIDDTLKIIAPDTYFFFLGDLVDRGAHGCDLLTLVSIFAVQNCGKVFLIRGNHENLDMNMDKRQRGFAAELARFFALGDNLADDVMNSGILEKISVFYNLLPDVAFVGCNNNYLQCCHGGIEIRYDAKKLLAQPQPLIFQMIRKSQSDSSFLRIIKNLDPEKRFDFDQNVSVYFTNTFFGPRLFEKNNLGFLWNDFNNDPSNNYKTYYQPGRGLSAGKKLTEALLSYYSTPDVHVRGIMRAHQHNSTLPAILDVTNSGVYPMWHNRVITNLSTSQFTGIIACNKITFFDDYHDWQMVNFYSKDKITMKQRPIALENWDDEEDLSEQHIPLFVKFNEELRKPDPNYTHALSLLQQITKNYPKEFDAVYEAAHAKIAPLQKFIYALGIFNDKAYNLSAKLFEGLVDDDYLKLRAREYYAQSVLFGAMRNKYRFLRELLLQTLQDPDTSESDKLIADMQLKELNTLSNA